MTTTTISQGIEANGGVIQATDQTTWADLGSSPFASWANWTTWHPNPNSVIIQVDIDTFTDALRTPILDVRMQGELSVELKITNSVFTDSNGFESGLFAGEETTVDFTDPEEIYVRGRFYRWTITVATDSNLTTPLLFMYSASFTELEDSETFQDLDTSTLTGTINAREIASTIGVCSQIIATAHQEGVTYSSGQFQDRQYSVPDDFVFQENAIVVNIVSKAPPTIRCFDLNGESIDAIVDVRLVGLKKITLTDSGVSPVD